jgi:nicotinate phosphoribosyltransferase
MTRLTDLYRPSLALLTDLYQLTMAFGYWKLGRLDERACFHMFYRVKPFQGGYAIAAGLDALVDYLRTFRFTGDDIAYLATLTGNDGRPLLAREFLDYLAELELSIDVDAVPEGTVVFPHEPLVRVVGPLLQCQILETAILNIVNFQSLIATKAARICGATQGESVLEFGLRRAQGVDGALAASRAAYIGGCAATSNVLAGRLFGIPVRGTHAHSWVMSFDDETAAFEAYARAMPNNCVFLVDTYDTLDGVKHAIQAARRLREQGHEVVGVRLDSGDLAYLSIEARKLLDQAGFPNAVIVASNDLDEHIIESLKQQGAQVAVWGVGTKLVTAYDQPALGGVYKMSAIKEPDQPWQHKVKVSEQTIKVSSPGILQIRRFCEGSRVVADMIWDELTGIAAEPTIVDPLDPTHRRAVIQATASDNLLVPVVREGRIVYQSPPLPKIRARTADQLAMFHTGIRRLVNPHTYPVGLERHLHELKTRLILQARGAAE